MFLSKQVQHGLIAGALIFTVLGVGVAQAASPQFLEQNWSKSTRQEFYTTSQGSQIMPYKCFKPLERAESDAGFSPMDYGGMAIFQISIRKVIPISCPSGLSLKST